MFPLLFDKPTVLVDMDTPEDYARCLLVSRSRAAAGGAVPLR